MSDLFELNKKLSLETVDKTSPTQNRRSTKYFTPSASPRTSLVHQLSPQQITDHTSDGSNKQTERLSLFRRLTLSFRRSLRPDKDIVKSNLDPIEKPFVKKNDDSINTEPASCKFDVRKRLFYQELFFSSSTKSR
jgi:hypothetical protein